MSAAGGKAPVAIIGVGLRLPGADRLATFGAHLAAGRSLISQVPANRWNAEELLGDPARGNRTSSIWGGFVEDADCFDASFFGISPREAAWMDPQQRFALEMAWHAIEDAGYRASDLAGSRTGVYMGVCHWDYAELLEKHLPHVDAYLPTGIAFSIIANRVSHFFDLQGPSITNDTACAASMTSIYEAVRALQGGECDMALAGGVNLIWSPNHFVAFSKAGMLSKTGRSNAFDDAADGYVRGEGGAVLLLKPLGQALADGDPIHAVIRGIGVNHGGRTNSLTVTNPRAQAALIKAVHREAGVAPDSVSYVEAHGPGTPLGDPIEISGLKEAFADLHAEAGTTPRAASCGIGSVKTNIGHLEGAAGVAGIVKVLVALAREELPGNVGFTVQNRLIDLAGTPFRIQKEASPWPRTEGAPRRACVSSFGFGGSNAHVLIEEAPKVEAAPRAGDGEVHLVPLSAADEERLQALVSELLATVEAADAPALADLAHTLRIGRAPLDVRVAFLVRDRQELEQALHARLGGTDHPAVVDASAGATDEPLNDLALRWASGEDIDWLAAGLPKGRRVRAPLYPFARERHWMDGSLGMKDDRPAPHPMIQRNISGFAGPVFESTLRGPELFWADHKVRGRQILPGVAALEMARAAADLAGADLGGTFALQDVVWSRPIAARETPVTVETHLTRQADRRIGFTIRAAGGDAANVRGTISSVVDNAPSAPALAKLQDELREEVPAALCYERLQASGVDHGPAFRALARVSRDGARVLAQLKLPRRLHPTLASLPLHPVMLDAAIQAWIALDEAGPNGAAVPFACRRVVVQGTCEPVMWAVVTERAPARATAAVRHLDIHMLDRDGNPRVSFEDLALRIVAAGEAMAEGPKGEATDDLPPVLAESRWRPAPEGTGNAAGRDVSVLLAGFAEADLARNLVRNLSEASGQSVSLLAGGPDADPAAIAIGLFNALHARIVEAMREKPRRPRHFLMLAPESLPQSVTAPLAALLRTAATENPKISGALVRIEGPADTGRLADLLRREVGAADTFTELRYRADGAREALRIDPVDLSAPLQEMQCDPDGAYWITGGAGGLGLILAGWLAARGARNIVLSGRSAQDDSRFEALRERGAAVTYAVCDMGDAAAVDDLAQRIAREIGPLKGVIHAAGLLDDGYILTQAGRDFAPVFAPKLAGTLHLDRATRTAPLDFLVLFSSVAARFGNAGQAAYAGANGFLDGFAIERAEMVARGERRGRTLAVAWPLWAEGGMSVDRPTLEAMERRFGTVPLPSAAGLAALERLLVAGQAPCATVLYGDTARIGAFLAEREGAASTKDASASSDAAQAAGDDAALARQGALFVRDILADVLELDPSRIRLTRKLEEYGLDSISIVETTNRLEERLGPLSKTLFFEYVDLEGVAGHLVENHREALAAALAEEGLDEPASARQTAPAEAIPARADPGPSVSRPDVGTDAHAIAIVGLSLHVSGAATQDEFWEMLAGGIHGFRSYPQERWNHAALLHPERDVLGKTVVRTGCFLDDIDRFDPRYFRISQTEAELMSPEVRLFLQASVEAFENAGYSRETLQRRYAGDVAVIVGSMTNEYDLYGFQNMLMRGSPASGSYTGTVPNMVSYYYGFTGPSYFLDTMCSAASTCVHEAVHMLRAGRCEMALAGGVSLLLHPQKLIATSQEHFTTKSADVIRGYGLGAEGTILGEGVGALVLKRLCDAERDGDHIHGVIIGTGISNAGVRNGFTVPNPHQQAVAIERALDDAGITADTVSYIEGHGSGTALGDPIEVKALTQAFRKHTDAVGACPIGTVKSNVGHLLGASGLAGIAKVVAQLDKGMLAPSLHAETLNPDIPFATSPFRVQRDLSPWQRPLGADGRELPRRAGVTSIGAGGMNSHILIEEYRPHPRSSGQAGPELLVFSAMNQDRLVALVQRHLSWMEHHPEADLSDIAFTLQVGRTELPCRLALAASDLADARRRLAAFAAAPGAKGAWHYVRSILDVDPPEDRNQLAAALAARDLDQVADAWTHGATIDWFALWRGREPRRVPLPTYPFEKIRCWYPEQPDAPSVVNPLGSRLKLHPFIGRNVSTLSGLRYETDIHLGELLDYVHTQGRRQTVLPMVAVEAVAALARIAGLPGPVSVENLQVLGLPDWQVVKHLTLTLEPAGDAFLARVVAQGGEEAETPWLEARISSAGGPAGRIDLDGLKTASTEVLEHARIYGDLARNGLGFGPYLEGMARAYRLSDGGLLCELREDAPQQDWFRKTLQLPSTALGAVWQALQLLAGGGAPLALTGVSRVLVSNGDVAAVLCQPGSDGAYDLSFLDAAGGIVARCEGAATVPVAEFAAAPSVPAPGPPRPAARGADETVERVARELRRIAAGILKFNPDDVGPREPFHDLGFDSISLTRYAGEIGSAFGIELSPAIFFECEHVEALAEHLVRRYEIAAPTDGSPATPVRAAPLAAAPAPIISQPVASPSGTVPGNRIAIIGMAGRFPGSPDVDSFFDNLLAGRDLTSELPLERYGEAYRARLAATSFPRRGGFLSDIDRFDAAAFRISPAEAERMDPQQRLLLETAWQAVEHAGIEPSDLPKATGVFVGVTSLDYAALLAAHGIAADGYVATGNSLAMVANRVSHAFDLSGPSEAIDTACSSSLVALLRGAQALKGGRCDVALVGGVNLCLAAEGFEGPHNAGMLSPDGRCKSFGAGADGYARGEGVAVLMLKRLTDARRDGDRILGTIIGGAQNHGGRAGALTAPNAKAQAALVEEALAGIDPTTIGYIEAHGTGTHLGDPVEINGLKRAFATLSGRESVAEPHIGLGTVKSSIGHLEAAAGLAGVVKLLMAMQRGELPPTLHCDEINPHVELAGSPFRLVRRREAWPRPCNAAGAPLPRRAGVSSFGFGGTNAHVVLEEHLADGGAERSPLPPRRFAATRYWIPGVSPADETLVFVPDWREQDAPAGGFAGRRIVVACGVDVEARPGCELVSLALGRGGPGTRYAQAATHLLSLLRDLVRQPGEGRVLVQLAFSPAREGALLAGLGAMLDTAGLEDPRIFGQVIELPEGLAPDHAARLLASEAGTGAGTRIRYSNGQRLERTWREVPAGAAKPFAWRPRGVALVTGGMGRLGRLIARDIAETAKGSVLVLTGSGPLDDAREAFLDELRALGAVAGYRQVDMGDAEAVAGLVAHVIEVHGRLDAVVHCAGTLRDGHLAWKQDADLAEVLAPKVTGALALREARSGLDLDAFVLFSSLAGSFGNAGQADYAAANGFLDALAEHSGGRITSIGWPLWRDGGMEAGAEVEAALFQRLGQRPLETEAGLGAMHAILGAGHAQAAVIAGDGSRARRFFLRQEASEVLPSEPQAKTGGTAVSSQLLARTTARLGELFAKISGHPAGRIDPQASLEEYGIDSLVITRLNSELGGIFEALPKTLFFQYRTLGAIAGWLAERQPEACRRWTGLGDDGAAPAPAIAAAAKAAVAPSRAAPLPLAEPIAVIGLAGRYPGADTLDAFWENLQAGRDMVGEIPAERWDLEGFFETDVDEAVASGRSYSRWGAFLEGFAGFDPLFFRISPRDAAAMDPQERLFLMCAWAACEDAGYTRARLKQVAGGREGADVGVFAGVTKTGYALHGPFRGEGGAMVRPSTSFASVANRVSHALDLAGPSLPVDTMCSSSLTAIHEACEQLRAGQCAMALAGGVNLYLHPSNYVELCAAHMLSPSGRCHSFGAEADGFVPGEGVGCVLLKPLSRALADGDRIHAVIRGSAINHGGRATGYTVPSPAAQRDVVRAALDRAGLSARDVSYIEAHGTGTVLGDPIEVDGLTQAFAPDTAEAGFCALGSVKSAIGHLEAAAGIAGLTKVILQMRHGMLAPTLHAETPNPNLDLAVTPFVLQRQAAAWRTDGPRIAGISSFGAGGANAHVIVEEWRGEAASAAPVTLPQAIVLSARTPEQLRTQAENLLAVLRSGAAAGAPAAPQAVAPGIADDLAAILGVEVADIDPGESFDALGLERPELLALRRRLEERFPAARLPLLDRFASIETLAEALAAQGVTAESRTALPLDAVAYTLQVGREAFAHRLGIEAQSVEDLAARLSDWLAGKAGAGIHTGAAEGTGGLLATLRGDGVLQELAERAWQDGRLDKLLALWAGGIDIDWARLPRSTRPAIVSLPTYPFARDRYWLPRAAAPVGGELEHTIAVAQGDARLEAEQDRLDRLVACVLAAQLARVPENAVTQDLRRWYSAARDLLARNGGETLSEDDAWTRWRACREAGGLAAQMRLAEAALSALPDILTGVRKATDVLFPQGSLELVEAVYKQNAVAARFSETLAQAAARLVGNSRLERPLRILEIGAGTGGTSEPVFAALAPLAGRIAEYCYTDVSRAFLIHAERSYAGRVPGLKTALLDIEKPLAGQGVEPGRYDLVIAANVLHATADIVRTLKTVRETMAPGGVLLVNETSRATLFTHVTFGLLEGWWRFTDGERRIPGTPSLAPESWTQALRQAGFDWIAGSGEAERRLGQQLFAARATGADAQPEVLVEKPAVALAPTSGPQAAASKARHDLRGLLRSLVATTLNVAPESVDATRSFADYGLDSILGAEFAHRLRKALGIPFDQTRLFDFASIGQLEAFLRREHADALAALNSTDAVPIMPLAAPAPAPAPVPAPVPARSVESAAEPIAIIGASGRFAGSQTVEEFWRHLMAGDDLVGPVTRFDLAPHYRHVPEGSYGRHGSFIEGVDRFDAVFFGISGLEATWMDPQQRLFLEEAWKTLEHAGHAGADIVGSRCGVFVGCAHGDYQELFREQPPGQAFWGNTTSLIPSRLSYWLDLRGPAIAVDTACSSSLVAVHMACRSLREGECDMALAGGVFVQSSPRFFLYANQANMLSPSGRCAPFGAGADGIVPGEAVAAVLLKPLSRALADGDTVHGVILGSGTNQDGTTNGITAPSALSQERLMREVYERFGIDPASIAVVEAHGTGTPLGDPIEHAALARVHGGGQAGEKLLGSVKSNIGHATTAAGIAGLIKALWSLKHAMVPPVLHFGGGNPGIDFSHSRFRVNGEPLAFPARDGTPRRAAVSSFGFGGTNAHAVLQEAPTQPQVASLLPSFLFVFSARNEALLRQLAERMAAHLETASDDDAADIAHTLLVGRRPMVQRLAVVATGTRDLAARLRAWVRGEKTDGLHHGEAAPAEDSDAAALARACVQIADALKVSQGTDPQAWRDGLQQLAGAWVRGGDIDGAGLFGSGRRRVPLPASPLAGKSYWVAETSKSAPRQPTPRAVATDAPRMEQGSAPVASAEPALPLRLADPAALAGPYEGVNGRMPSVRLAPLDAIAGPAMAQRPQETGGVRLAGDQGGVRRLDLTGRWSEATRRELESALREAGEDATLRVVVVQGGEGWSSPGATAGTTITAALLDCPLPVVAVLEAPLGGDGAASALLADFVVRAEDATMSSLPVLPEGLPWQLAARRIETGVEAVAPGSVETAATELAASIADAPRAALVLLKAHMRKAMPQLVGAGLTGSPQRGRLQQLMREVGASSPTEMSSRRVPLASPIMELEAFPDGVVLLRMLERAGRNTFTTGFMDGIEEAFTAIAAMPEAKVVVLTGHDGYFACGGTSEGLTELQAGEARFTDRRIYSLPLACPLPVIAAMQGHGIGAGWSLGLYCDAAILATEGLYHSNYLWYGFTPGAGATLIFPHRLGDDLGREVLFSAREYRGRELAGRAPHLDVLPAARVLGEALAWAHALARQPKGDLLAAKAEDAAVIVQHLDEVLQREFAMHETTFIGSDRVRARIAEKFGDTSPAPVQQPAQVSAGRVDLRPNIREQLLASLAEDLMIEASDIRDDAGFLDLGLDSILAVTWIRKLNALFGVELPATVVYAHPTVGALADHIGTLVPSSASPQPAPEPAATVVAAAAPAPSGGEAHHAEIRERLVASLAEDLMIEATEVRDEAGFLELGLDSILAVTWVRKLNALFGIDLPATVVYAHPTVGALVRHVAGLVPVKASTQAAAPVASLVPPAPAATAVVAPVRKPDEPPAVAIIGASGIFPKAADLEAFWRNIREGRDCIEEVPPSRWDVARFYHPDPAHPGTSYCKWMGALEGVDLFDARFFGITPREAELMDPQQRLFLQVAWHAIEDAAIDPQSLAGRNCGIYVSSGPSGYEDLIEERNAYSLLGSSGSILAARMSYMLDLRGPSLSIDTACSSSLVAIAEACESLVAGTCDMALAGGACVLVGPKMFIDTSKVAMLSKDGRCFTFDARANGFVPGEGVGAVLLKRLDDALRDGDPIRAVLRGWGTNQDGRTNGITAPNPQAQTALMRSVQARFGIDPATIGLVECHGTGTPLGDPIEIEGLRDAFRDVPAGADCRIGSVKSNIGHCLASAGVAGALKAMLALEQAERPPVVNFDSLNPHISLNGTPFALTYRAEPWPARGRAPRRAAVSSYGFSGTNAHLVLEEAPAPARPPASSGPWLLVLSALARERLQEYAAGLERFVAAHPDLDLGALAHTLQVGRTAFASRLAFAFTGREDLLRALASVAAGHPLAGVHVSDGDRSATAPFDTDAEARALVARWLASGEMDRLSRVGELWAKGLAVDWSILPPQDRLRLPGYPFARERYWVEPGETAASETPAMVAPPALQSHPLLDGATARGEIARFSVLLTGDEPSLTSHLSADRRLVLGLFLPELARGVLERAGGRPVQGLRHLLWGAPLAVNGHPRHLTVVVGDDGQGLLYRVVADGDEAAPWHFGAAVAEDQFPPRPARAERLAPGAGTDLGEAYRAFAERCAIHSGPPAPEAATVDRVSLIGDRLVAELRRPRGEAGSAGEMLLDPAWLDAAWRLLAFRLAGHLAAPATAGALKAPVAVESMFAWASAGERAVLHVEGGHGLPLVLSLYDDEGNACMVMRDVRLGSLEAGVSRIALAGEGVR